MSYPELVAKYQDLMSQAEHYRQSNKAMETRLRLKEQESQNLQAQIKSTQETLSLQLHTMKDMQKPLLVDPTINNEFTELRYLIQDKRTQLADHETESAEYYGKPFLKGTKLLTKWQELSEEVYSGFSEFAEGKAQNLHLEGELAKLHISELKQRIEESKELIQELEKESSQQYGVLNELHTKYRQLQDQIQMLKKEPK